MGSLYQDLLTALPESPDVIGREESSSSVVFAPFLEVNNELCLLFEKRASDIPQGDEICFPGGRHEEGDNGDLRLTAIRETEEELGIPRDRIHIEGRVGSLYGALGVVVELFAGRIDGSGLHDFQPNADEVAQVLLVPFRWFVENPPEIYELEVQVHPFRMDENGRREDIFPARQLGLPQRYWNSWSGRPSPIFAYRVQGEVIWGMTARMVRHLVKLVQG